MMVGLVAQIFDPSQGRTWRSSIALSRSETPEGHVRHILLATDGSASANRAQWFAAALARQFSSRLTVLTVVHNEPDAELEVFGQIGGTSVPELAEQTAADVLSSAKKEV